MKLLQTPIEYIFQINIPKEYILLYFYFNKYMITTRLYFSLLFNFNYKWLSNYTMFHNFHDVIQDKGSIKNEIHCPKEEHKLSMILSDLSNFESIMIEKDYV